MGGCRLFSGRWCRAVQRHVPSRKRGQHRARPEHRTLVEAKLDHADLRGGRESSGGLTGVRAYAAGWEQPIRWLPLKGAAVG